MISWWHHHMSTLRNGSRNGRGLSSSDLLDTMTTSSAAEDFCLFSTIEAGIWREMYLDWILLGERVHVVYYEEVRREREREIRWVVEDSRVQKVG